MITEKYIDDIDDISWAEQEAEFVGYKLIAKQHQIASVFYTRRTGRLINGLKPSAVNVGAVNSERIFLSISYPLHIRFNDMKKKPHRKCGGVTIKHRRGKAYKKNYAPIYNKYVYGFLLKGLYIRLRSRLGEEVYSDIDAYIKNMKFT